jgi:hypothetical protein
MQWPNRLHSLRRDAHRPRSHHRRRSLARRRLALRSREPRRRASGWESAPEHGHPQSAASARRHRLPGGDRRRPRCTAAVETAMVRPRSRIVRHAAAIGCLGRQHGRHRERGRSGARGGRDHAPGAPCLANDPHRGRRPTAFGRRPFADSARTGCPSGPCAARCRASASMAARSSSGARAGVGIAGHSAPGHAARGQGRPRRHMLAGGGDRHAVGTEATRAGLRDRYHRSHGRPTKRRCAAHGVSP